MLSNIFWFKQLTLVQSQKSSFYLYHRFRRTPASRSLVKCVLQELKVLIDRNTLSCFPPILLSFVFAHFGLIL